MKREPETLTEAAMAGPHDATAPAGAPEIDGPLTVQRHHRPDGRQLLIFTVSDGDET